MNEHSLTPVKPLIMPAWVASGYSRGNFLLAGIRIVATTAEIELAMERTAIMTTEGATEFDAQTQALCELQTRRRITE